jgi:DNA-binding CsgD family transcriptional regulator
MFVSGGSMAEAPFGLTEKEREVLRLLASGHDAKSAAAVLCLSVHTINERLREARRKTGAGTSRGAARLLVATEAPQLSVPNEIGVAEETAGIQHSAPLHSGAPGGSRWMSRWGVQAMVAGLLLGVLAFAWAGSERSVGPISEAPRVVATFPAPGAVVPPGPVTLRVTYDRPMRRQSYSFVQKSPGSYPDCGKHMPQQSADGRTFTLRCEVRAGRSYEIWFNRPPYMNFTSDGGVPASPFQLLFRTR